MSMTKLEKLAKEEVLTILSEEGYPTYAKLLSKFEVNLTADPNVVGYMEPEKGRIVLNKGLDIEQVSVIARHEILHFYLEHERRLLSKLASETGADLDDLDDIRVGDLRKDLYKNKNFNIAADYEISNRGYTDADKETIRNIQLNGQTLKGLVTEDDHPEWVNMSVEEMYDELRKQMNQEQQQASQNAQSAPQDKSQGGQQGNDGQDQQGQSSPQIGDKGDQQIQQAEEAQREAEELADRAQKKSQQSEQDDFEQDDFDDEEEEGDDTEPGGSPVDSEGTDADSEEEGGGTPDSINSTDSTEQDGQGTPDSSSNSETSSDPYDQLSDNAQKVANAADQLADKIEKDKEGEEPKVFKTPEEKVKEAENEARLQDIKKMLNDLKTQEKILDETNEVVRAEQRKKAEKNLQQYNASPLNSFKMSLQGFIKNQVSQVKGTSWSKINKTYAHSSIMKPGRTRYSSGKVPLINVYFDQSGSWGPNDIKIGEQAIATLNKYVKQGDIQIKLYYFDTVVSGNRSDMVHGGTNLAPVISHINSTKPDNVIIMTDSDGNWTKYTEDAKVPGAVWFLWRNSVSEELQKHLSGKELTKSFRLD